MLGVEFASILDAARGGSRPALGALYRDLFPSVVAYLRVRVPREAEDLASEVFLAVATGLGGFEGDESGFRGWVFTIARRRAIDAARRARRQHTQPVAPETLTGVPGSSDPAEEALTRVRAAEAFAALDRLPTAQAEVIRLRVVAGLSVEETATAMGRRPGAVRVLQHRALQRLARILGSEEGDGAEDGDVV